MASEAVLLFRTFYEQGNPNGKLLASFLTSAQNLLKLYDIVDMWSIYSILINNTYALSISSQLRSRTGL